MRWLGHLKPPIKKRLVKYKIETNVFLSCNETNFGRKLSQFERLKSSFYVHVPCWRGSKIRGRRNYLVSGKIKIKFCTLNNEQTNQNG